MQEEIQETRRLTKEEIECERQFCKSVTPDSPGRCIVALPEKPEVNRGDPENLAIRRLYSFKRRFKRSPEVNNECIKFIEDYEGQQYMSLIPHGEYIKSLEMYVLPHHCN